MKKEISAIWLFFVVFAVLTGCKKDETIKKAPESQATAVLSFKNGNVNNLEVGMYGIFDASKSYGYDSTRQFNWQMGDGSQIIQTNIDKLAYRYSDVGDYTIRLLVFDSSGNSSMAEICLQVVAGGTLKSQVLLRNASAPDSAGKIEYTIALALDSCQALTGPYQYLISDGIEFKYYDFDLFEEINGEEYGVFKISVYNQILNFSYSRDGDLANTGNSVFYNPATGLLQATLKDGEMLPLDQLEEYLPGEEGDDVLRIIYDNQSIRVCVNFKQYAQQLNHPWIGFSSDNVSYLNQKTFWLGGTGWGQLVLTPTDLMFIKFGGNSENQSALGEMEQSMFYMDNYKSIVLKFIPMKK